MIVLGLSLVLAFILGFSAHRAGICTVSAVAEVITSRTARTFSSFLKVVLWVALINGVAAALYPEFLESYVSPAFSVSVVAGGLLFGIGTGINNGCSFSTISKIAQGELHFALTLPAFVAGAIGARSVALNMPVAETGLYAVDFADISLIVLSGLSIWGAIELFGIIRSVAGKGIIKSITRERYTLSGAAALIGVSSGFLYLFYGRWGYSSKVLDYFADDSATPYIGTMAFYLLVTLLAGAATSALSRGKWSISFAADKWHRNLSGGFLMGFGAMLVPGGNGKLMLHDLPHLSVHAIIAYLAMVAGILLTLLVQKRVSGQIDIVSCAGDECAIIKAGKPAAEEQR